MGDRKSDAANSNINLSRILYLDGRNWLSVRPSVDHFLPGDYQSTTASTVYWSDWWNNLHVRVWMQPALNNKQLCPRGKNKGILCGLFSWHYCSQFYFWGIGKEKSSANRNLLDRVLVNREFSKKLSKFIHKFAILFWRRRKGKVVCKVRIWKQLFGQGIGESWVFEEMKPILFTSLQFHFGGDEKEKSSAKYVFERNLNEQWY